MSINNKDDDYEDPNDSGSGGTDEGGSTGEGGIGGRSGEIRFSYKKEILRDDLLPPSEIQRLLAVQKELHKSRVDKQKTTRKERAALKEGRQVYSVSGTQQSLRGGRGNAQYRNHPVLAKATQFDGIDPSVSFNPAQNQAETNEERRNELENRLQLNYSPKFNPKPRPY